MEEQVSFLDRGIQEDAVKNGKMEAAEPARPEDGAKEPLPEFIRPGDIEKRSFQIISEELARRGIVLSPRTEMVVKRCIHTSADFDYAENLCFSEDGMERALAALRDGADIVTDTHMAQAGISRTALSKLGGRVCCFMSDEDVAADAKARGVTRAAASMDKAAKMASSSGKDLIYAIGNAPTALIRLTQQIEEGIVHPRLVIGVPVGFVNVVQAKEMIMRTDVPYIVARGRKGGSNIAAAIVNALLYTLCPRP